MCALKKIFDKNDNRKAFPSLFIYSVMCFYADQKKLAL